MERPAVGPRAIVILGLGLTAAYAGLLLLAMARTDFNTWGGLLVLPVLMAITLPILGRYARLRGEPGLFGLLTTALLVRLCLGTVARLYVAYGLYGGQADVLDWDKWGRLLAPMFRAGNFHTGLHGSIIGSNFTRILTGVVYAIAGPSELAGYMVFAWLGFWGLFFFYKAFVIAVPEGKSRTYARLVFFLPSLVFWPSAIGKDAWMIFSLGIAAYGVARCLTGSSTAGLTVAAAGLWGATLIRPHMAALVAIGLAAAFAVRRTRPGLRELAPVAKVLSLAVVLVLAGFLVVKTQNYLKNSFIQSNIGISALQQTATVTATEGGSQYSAPIVNSPLRVPLATATVLFRPFPFEAHNKQELLAAIEASFVLALSLLRFRWIIAALKSVRRQPYVVFALVYTAIFIFGYSAFANFGLLARERTQLMPVYLILLAIPPRKRVNEELALDARYG